MRFETGHFSTFAVLEYEKPFTDVIGHWAETSIKKLAAKHIVQGVDHDV
ncbi:S-layer homology domain-containing protein [Paenibacillus sp. MBLB4367]